VCSIRVFCVAASFILIAGFTVNSRKKKKKPKKQKVIKEDSDDDDKEWIPGCEDTRRTRSKCI